MVLSMNYPLGILGPTLQNMRRIPEAAPRVTHNFVLEVPLQVACAVSLACSLM